MSETILPLLLYAFTTSITPGPNNMILMASGANFGVRRTLPHMFGVAAGFAFLALVMGGGAAQLVKDNDTLKMVMKALSILFMGYIAWKIATAKRTDGKARTRPMRFLEAAAFQWINPKAVAMAITAVLNYAPNDRLSGVFIVVICFGLVNLVSISTWAIAGETISKLLNTDLRFRAFNITMAILLVVSMLPILRF